MSSDVYYNPDGVDDFPLEYGNIDGIADERQGNHEMVKESLEFMLSYYEQLSSYVIPSDNYRLLQHLIYFSLFLNDLNEIYHPRPIPIYVDNLQAIQLDKVFTIAWEWHNDIINKDEPITGLYAKCILFSWGSFCRIFHLIMFKQKERYETIYQRLPQTKHPYCEQLHHQFCIAVSQKPISKFTIRETFNSARLLVPTMYYYQYNTAMKQYLHMLFLRYSHFVSLPVNIADSIDYEDDGDDDADAIEYYDDPSFVDYTDLSLPYIPMYSSNDVRPKPQREDKATVESDEEEDEEEEEEEEVEIEEKFDAFKSILIPVNREFSLKSSFIYDWELLFYSQLRRVNLSHILAAKVAANPIMLIYKQDRRSMNAHKSNIQSTVNESRFCPTMMKCHELWIKYINQISTSEVLRYSTNERVKQGVMEIQLLHGEREKFKREWPELSRHAMDILSKFREADYMECTRLQQTPLTQITLLYSNSIMGIIKTISSSSSKNGSDKPPSKHPNPLSLFEYPILTYEKECVLLTKVCHNIWFSFQEVPEVIAINEAFILEEESDTRFADIDALILGHKRHFASQTKDGKHRGTRKMVPLLIRLVRVYYVLDLSEPVIRAYSTHLFQEAYMLWLALLVKRKFMMRKHFPEDLLNALKLFIDSLSNPL